MAIYEFEPLYQAEWDRLSALAKRDGIGPYTADKPPPPDVMTIFGYPVDIPVFPSNGLESYWATVNFETKIPAPHPRPWWHWFWPKRWYDGEWIMLAVTARDYNDAYSNAYDWCRLSLRGDTWKVHTLFASNWSLTEGISVIPLAVTLRTLREE